MEASSGNALLSAPRIHHSCKSCELDMAFSHPLQPVNLQQAPTDHLASTAATPVRHPETGLQRLAGPAVDCHQLEVSMTEMDRSVPSQIS